MTRKQIFKDISSSKINVQAIPASINFQELLQFYMKQSLPRCYLTVLSNCFPTLFLTCNKTKLSSNSKKKLLHLRIPFVPSEISFLRLINVTTNTFYLRLSNKTVRRVTRLNSIHICPNNKYTRIRSISMLYANFSSLYRDLNG